MKGKAMPHRAPVRAVATASVAVAICWLFVSGAQAQTAQGIAEALV
jgi:hypothetical protein